MSNPWSEAYKNFREESLEEARKLKDVQTAGTQGKYDLKSKVAKMRQEGKSEMEIKQWLDRYLQNSKLPGEQKATMRTNALQSESVDVVSEGPEEYAGGQHPSKHPDKRVRDKYETESRRKTAPRGVGVPDKSVGYGQLKQSFEPEGDEISEAEVLAMKDGVPGSVKVKPKFSIPGTNIGVGPNVPVKGTFTTTTPEQRAKIEKGDTTIDRGLYKQSRVGAGPTSNERRRYNRELVRQGKHDAPRMRLEELELVSEAEERVLVRITTEDGRVFEKKVPKDKISELRQRYKSVVEVGSSDSKPKMTSKQGGSEMKESKDKPKRWWDDDGDGVGYEEGEVSGKFKRKKKTKKESYSDWRSDMDLSEEQLGVSPREMRSQGNEKKK